MISAGLGSYGSCLAPSGCRNPHSHAGVYVRTRDSNSCPLAWAASILNEDAVVCLCPHPGSAQFRVWDCPGVPIVIGSTDMYTSSSLKYQVLSATIFL